MKKSKLATATFRTCLLSTRENSFLIVKTARSCLRPQEKRWNAGCQTAAVTQDGQEPGLSICGRGLVMVTNAMKILLPC